MSNLTLPGAVDLVAERDKEDCLRHILGNLVVPVAADEMVAILESFTKSGMGTKLPSGKLHCQVCEVQVTLDAAVSAGWAHVLSGRSTFAGLAEHTDGLASTLSHTYPDGEGGQVNRVLEWAAAKQKRLNEGETGVGLDPTVPHYVMTHAGHLALTGHEQGERPEWADEGPVDPASITPAEIGA